MNETLYSLLLIAMITLLFSGSAGFIYIIIDSIKTDKQLEKYKEDK